MPLANRATIANMSPEFGSTCAIFPIDDKTIDYLRLTGRADDAVALVEAYAKDQGLWLDPAAEPRFSEKLELDPVSYTHLAVTGIILVLAANTAFNGFPVLGSILAKDGFLPRQLQSRGDRLAFSNGIAILAAAAIFLVIAYNADVTQLIQLYIVGVFVSFSMSQTGMIRHWNRLLKEETDPKARSKMFRARIINAVGAAMSITVLLVVLVTKFQAGAKYAILAMAVLYVCLLYTSRCV